jgi:cellulose synthase (UDP-forming)
MVKTGAHRRERYQQGLVIPTPPEKHNHYQYLGKQHLRLLSIMLFIFSLGAVYGLYAVFSKTWQLYPFLLILVVMVPWVLYIVVLSTYRPRVTWESHQKVLVAGEYMLKHSVDVFVPVCGEDIRIIKNTLYHVARLKWDGPLNIYCLDDGDSREVERVAKRCGVHYLVRDDRPLHKKSGNLNNGLAHSNGEFVLVFDADFAPHPEFLLETIPYMLYTNLGIVQTAQYFDVKLHNTRNWVQQMSGSAQDLFFCWAQPARNTADAAMCVGTNVIYRRKALDAIGGFPRVSAGGEDIVTGLEMYSKGFRTLYLPLVLAKGACPDNFNSCINQQYRWSGTSMKMFYGKNEYHETFKRAHLKISQKLVFWSGALYYMQSILTLIITVLPSIVMLWFFPFQVGPGNYIPIAPAMLGMFALPFIVRGWRPSVLRLIVVYSVAHLLAGIDSFRVRNDTKWIPSGAKTKSNTSKHAGLIIRVWYVVGQSLIWIALFRDIPIYGWNAYWVAALLCAFQTIVLFPLMLPEYGIVAQTTLIPHFIREGFSNWRARRYEKRYTQQLSSH